MKKIIKSFAFIAGISAFFAFFPGCASCKTEDNSLPENNSAPEQNTNLKEQTLYSIPGEKPETNGFFDCGDFSFPNTKIILIDDKTYPASDKKTDAFIAAIQKEGKKLIVIDGDIDLSYGKVSDSDHSYFDEFEADGKRKHADLIYKVASNTAIVGKQNARLKFGGLWIKNVNNIIIRNIEFYDAHGSTEIDTKIDKDSKASIDSINIENANNVWVDHCTFSDGKCVDLVRNFNHDGLLDIKKGKCITVSYCESFNHDKVMLLRPSDKFSNPEECEVTLHHNYFHDSIQRMPRSRGVNAHIYNNYFDNIGTNENKGSSLGPGIGSMYVVENNFFGKHAQTAVKYYDKSEKTDPTFSKFYQSGNIPQLNASNCAYDKVDKTNDFEAHLTSEKPFAINYNYSLDETSSLNEATVKKAGAGNLMKFER